MHTETKNMKTSPTPAATPMIIGKFALDGACRVELVNDFNGAVADSCFEKVGADPDGKWNDEIEEGSISCSDEEDGGGELSTFNGEEWVSFGAGAIGEEFVGGAKDDGEGDKDEELELFSGQGAEDIFLEMKIKIWQFSIPFYNFSFGWCCIYAKNPCKIKSPCNDRWFKMH